jgi:hypothetical protein
MKRFLPLLFAAALLPAWGQNSLAPYQIADNNAPPPETPPPAQPAAATAASELAQSTQKKHANTAADQAVIDQLASSNRDLLDLLKQQQVVLEDIQYDRRLQNRQITLIEDRLEDTLQTNTELQVKIAKLEGELAAASEKPATPAAAAPPAPQAHAEAVTAPVRPPPPSTYLPAAEPDGPPGAMGWHRLLTISGEDSKNSEVFHIEGRQWRVLWHNQDRPGPAYKNTSALFINAFPKNDNIPKKVCSQLGSSGDTTELTGKGDYYLKIEASGGHWEAAVEDFH